MRTKNKIKTVIFSFIALIIGIIAGLSSYALAFSPESDTLFNFASGNLTIHFLELGNNYAGDCIYIKANDNDILIDAGSRQNSATTIVNYVNKYCTDGTLEYLVATHAHQDHISAMPSTSNRKGIFDSYKVKNIIDFGTATKYERNSATHTQVYDNYVNARQKEIDEDGANYIAVSDYKKDDFQKTIDLGNGISIEILDNYYYYNSTSNENNYSVCLLIKQGGVNVLLTGDLEGEGEEKLVANNTLPVCDLFKAAHHGSYTGSTDALLNVIQPKNVVFTCVAGSTEYTTNLNNTFPAQATIDRVAKHTKNCFVTSVCNNSKTDLAAKKYDKFSSLNGDIIFSSNSSGYEIKCTNNNTLLKDTSWFKDNRAMPAKWAS